MEPATQRSSPEWASLEELHCPLCEYNLRGLSEPRCPECGYRFSWAELLDETRRRHPYLFEQPGRTGCISFLKTVSASWMPGAFWRSIHPAMAVRPWRLLLYWLLVCLPVLAIALVGGWDAWVSWGARGRMRIGTFLELALEAASPSLALCLWPWLLLLALMVFQVSMRRAKVRPRHVMRCIVYSSDGLFALSLVPFILVAWQYVYQHYPLIVVIRGPDAGEFALAALPIWLGVMTWRLRQAYCHYLRFDHPLATVMSAQVIVLLVYAIAATPWLARW